MMDPAPLGGLARFRRQIVLAIDANPHDPFLAAKRHHRRAEWADPVRRGLYTVFRMGPVRAGARPGRLVLFHSGPKPLWARVGAASGHRSRKSPNQSGCR